MCHRIHSFPSVVGGGHQISPTTPESPCPDTFVTVADKTRYKPNFALTRTHAHVTYIT